LILEDFFRSEEIGVLLILAAEHYYYMHRIIEVYREPAESDVEFRHR
jgi:hypothetical protein